MIRKPYWLGQKMELNAFTVPELLAFVEEELDRNLRNLNGKRKLSASDHKLVPPDDFAIEFAREVERDNLEQWATEWVAEKLDLTAKIDTLISESGDRGIGNPLRTITQAYRQNRSISWRDAIREDVLYNQGRHRDPQQARLFELLGLS